jgi:hypothetical protein
VPGGAAETESSGHVENDGTHWHAEQGSDHGDEDEERDDELSIAVDPDLKLVSRAPMFIVNLG